MVEKTKATLSKGRQSWCVIFRHPVALDEEGKAKKRVRRGLGTNDQKQAQELVDQMNRILEDAKLHNLASREVAATLYDERIVKAFYEPMTPGAYNPWAIRDEHIPLPGGKGSSDGYSRTLMIGTTGAGKTTIVRQFLGTDPDKDRFPSISAAKTTTSDFEVVMQEGIFKAIVTLLPRDRVRQYIVECILAAVVTKMEGKSDREVFRRLLEHSEQRFRLSYILGNPALLEKASSDELSDDEEPVLSESTQEISDAEREQLLNTLKSYLKAICDLDEKGRTAFTAHAQSLGIKIGEATAEDREALQELVEEDISNREEFNEFADNILEEVESRFKMVADGAFSRGRDEWPAKWIFESEDRAAFLRAVNRFTSNYANSFGRLLTPIVEGIRVAGPFMPTWNDGTIPKMVIMDGQGIGHTADSTSSLSTTVTSKFDLADAIVLVDNGAQPMQAAPCAVLQSVAISGHESKLIVAFTHFDEVKGPNMSQDTLARKEHVIGSFDNAVHAIGKSLGRETEAALRVISPDRLIFLANIQKKLAPETARFTVNELRRLLLAIQNTTVPARPVEFKPIYDEANLVLAIQRATQAFHRQWRGILGLGTTPNVSEAHWSQVKALSRRIGVFQMDEYDSLRPVADTITSLQKHIHNFLANPKGWNPSHPVEDSPLKVEAIDAIRKDVWNKLHDISRRRVLDDHLKDWLAAFQRRGTGSTRQRTKDIAFIYDEAIPIPSELPSHVANEFMNEVRKIIRECIGERGVISSD